MVALAPKTRTVEGLGDSEGAVIGNEFIGCTIPVRLVSCHGWHMQVPGRPARTMRFFILLILQFCRLPVPLSQPWSPTGWLA